MAQNIFALYQIYTRFFINLIKEKSWHFLNQQVIMNNFLNKFKNNTVVSTNYLQLITFFKKVEKKHVKIFLVHHTTANKRNDHV